MSEQLINFRLVITDKVYRSAAPYAWTEDHVSAFVDEYAVRTIVDLRTAVEGRIAPWHGLPNDTVSLANPGIHLGEGLDLNQLQTAEELGQVYLGALDTNRAELMAALAPVAAGEVTLFHCAAGKDRTGVVCALVELLAGHDDEQVIEQYTITQANMPQVGRALLAAIGSAAEAYVQLAEQNPTAIMTAPAGAMRTFLDGLHEQYGTAEQYLLQSGADTDFVTALIDRVRD